MRLFIGSVLCDANQTALASATRDLLAGTHTVLRATPAGTAHLTFSFIGHAEDADVARITDVLRRVSADWPPVALELAAARVFVARREPRLVYAPIDAGHHAIERMAAEMHAALTAELPALEPSPTRSPHVTLARFRKNARPSDAQIVERAIAESRLASLALRDAVSSLQIMRSTQTPSGPVYEEIAAVPLR